MGISVSNGEFYGILRRKYIELTSQHFSFYRKLLVMFPNDRGSTVNSRESDRPLSSSRDLVIWCRNCAARTRLKLRPNGHDR